jgi:hypothetical protein
MATKVDLRAAPLRRNIEMSSHVELLLSIGQFTCAVAHGAGAILAQEVALAAVPAHRSCIAHTPRTRNPWGKRSRRLPFAIASFWPTHRAQSSGNGRLHSSRSAVPQSNRRSPSQLRRRPASLRFLRPLAAHTHFGAPIGNTARIAYSYDSRRPPSLPGPDVVADAVARRCEPRGLSRRKRPTREAKPSLRCMVLYFQQDHFNAR